MTKDEFELFVHGYGKDILRFCRMSAGNREEGDDLYQDTMRVLLEKRRKLDSSQNTKSYALSIAILMWKNRQRKLANRMRLVPTESLDGLSEGGLEIPIASDEHSPEQITLDKAEIQMVQEMVQKLPEEYRIPIYLFYSSDLKVTEIAEILHLPEGTVKSRMHKAKSILKKEMEAIGYDR